MPQKQKLSLEEKVRIVKKYLVGESGIRNVAVEAGVDPATIQRWIMQYETEGAAAFLPHKRNTSAQICMFSMIPQMERSPVLIVSVLGKIT